MPNRRVPPPPRPRRTRWRRRQMKEHRRARVVCGEATKSFRQLRAGAEQPPRPPNAAAAGATFSTAPDICAVPRRNSFCRRAPPYPHPPQMYRLHATEICYDGQRVAKHGRGQGQPRREGGHEGVTRSRRWRAPATRDGGAAAPTGPRCSAASARPTVAAEGKRSGGAAPERGASEGASTTGSVGRGTTARRRGPGRTVAPPRRRGGPREAKRATEGGAAQKGRRAVRLQVEQRCTPASSHHPRIGGSLLVIFV